MNMLNESCTSSGVSPYSADRFGQGVLAVGVPFHAEAKLEQNRVAARPEGVGDAGLGHFVDQQHRVVARRIGDENVALVQTQPLAPRMADRHVLFVVVQIERVEVDALFAFDLGNP